MVEPAAAAIRLGPYLLGERLGLGGMAEVYVGQRAGPHGFAKKFAIKRILPELAKDSRFVAMFVDEARICAALQHPNIIQVVDFGESQGELFMAMEFVDGVSVANDATGRKLKFLRRVPVDPTNGSTEWGLRAYQDKPDSTSWSGQNVYDVYSKNQGTALDGTKYRDWN